MRRRLFYGWWILASSIVIMYLTGTVLFGFSAYYPSFIATFGWKRAQVLFGNTILQWAFGLMGLVWGTLADKRGVRPVLAIGTGCVAVACLLFGRITSLWELYAIDLVFGAGLSGMGYLSNQILLSRWFVSRRGLAIGTLNSAGAIGGAIAPVLHTFLIVHLGWRGAMSLLDVFLWLLPFPLILFVVKERPEQLGLYPDGAPAAAASADFGHGKGTPAESSRAFRQVFRTPVFWVVIGSVFLAAGTVGTTLQVLILYLRDSGFSAQMSAAALSLEFAVSVVGRLGFGALSDRFSASRVGAASFMLLGLSTLLLFVVRVPGMLVAFAVLQGLGHGAVVSFFPLMLAEVFGTKRHFGRLLAIGHLAYSSGLGTIPVIAGYAFDKTGSFGMGFMFNSVLTLLAAGALLFVGGYRIRTVRPTPAVANPGEGRR
jgi:OFA family oxalate/formate antiporter-like MFS transporter